MPDTETNLPPSDEDTGLDGDAGDEPGDEQGEDDVAVLKREIAELRTQNSKLGGEVKAQLGRFQSLLDRAAARGGATETQQRQIDVQLEAVKGALTAVLEDDTMSPEIRAKARAAAEKAEADAKLASMQAQLEARSGGSREAPSSRADFEEELEHLIESHGLDPDKGFDWSLAAQILDTQGKNATRAYFRKQIAELTAARQAAERRQSRKKAAGEGGPGPEGSSQRLLDDSKSSDEKLKWLIENGVLSA